MDTKPQQPTEILIEGRFYDVGTFRHPGGSILKFNMGGGDATEGFIEFHERSTKARKMLKALPNRPATTSTTFTPAEAARQQKLTQEYGKLRRELVNEGLFNPDYAHASYRMLEIVALFAIGISLIIYGACLLAYVPAVIILGIVTGRCGWWMHEAGHYSGTACMSVDLRIQEFFYGAGCAMSGAWWRIQHNKHHCAPQKINHDVDLNTLPLVAYHIKLVEKAKKNPFIKFWIPLQPYLFAPITCFLVSLFWTLFVHPRHMIRTRRYFEMVSVAIRYVGTAAVGYAADFTIGQTILLHCAVFYVAGMYIFINFALSHTHLPVLDKHLHVHWTEYAANYTINVAPHWFTDWWMGFLNYQIEHHLFPVMPQFRFVKLSPRIRAFFEANGLKYDVRGYFEALDDTFANLRNVGDFVKAA